MLSSLKIPPVTMTPLAAYGLVILAALCGFLGVSSLQDKVRAQGSLVIEAQSELKSLQNLEQTNIWETRLQQSVVMKASTDKTLWRGVTAGVVGAQLQQFLRAAAQENRVNNLRITIDPKPDVISGQSVLIFTMTGTAEIEPGAVHLLASIMKDKRVIIAQEVSIVLDPAGVRGSNFTISGFIPVIIDLKEPER